MNHVNGFDTTGVDLKLVELFAARQLCSSTECACAAAHCGGGAGWHEEKTESEQDDGGDDDDLEHTRSTAQAMRCALPASILGEPQWCSALVVKLSHHELHNHWSCRHASAAATTTIIFELEEHV